MFFAHSDRYWTYSRFQSRKGCGSEESKTAKVLFCVSREWLWSGVVLREKLEELGRLLGILKPRSLDTSCLSTKEKETFERMACFLSRVS